MQERASFAAWLNSRLVDRPVTAAELERDLGISQSLFSRYRNARAVPEIRRLRQLGKYLGDERGALLAAGHEDDAEDAEEGPASLAGYSDAELLLELARRAPAMAGRLRAPTAGTGDEDLVAEFEGRHHGRQADPVSDRRAAGSADRAG